ncbi:MAG TPA: hypothetical protein VFQ92_20085, partial [Blastocatellia bacterium]|nr:hypothetical protein [Blastocatellia bacterium]
MKPESGGLLLLAILIISGLQTLATPAPVTDAAPAPVKAPQSKPGEQKTDQSCYRNFERLLGEYTSQDLKLDFIVATVPDPIDSQIGWHFDLQIGAIQRAIEWSGYVVDRYSLPWSCLAMPVDAAKANSAHRLYEENPGIVIFRSKDEKDARLLALFLVGETPTSGIHKLAFESAMRSIAKQWQQEEQPSARQGQAVPAIPPARKIRLLGPTFSGSVKSLKSIIDVWWKENASKQTAVEFRIISGSASNVANKAELEREVDKKRFVEFQATVIPDGVLLSKLVEYLDDLGVDHHKVAVLTESNTGYGSALQHEIAVEAGNRVSLDATERAGQGPGLGEDHTTGECGARCWLSIPFPMHISKTRSAYEKSLPLKDQYNQLAGASADPGRTVLPLSLDESGNPRDVLPALAATTPLYDELVLSSTLSTISRAGFRYVGLLATDTKDKLFLARQVRKYCPDVRLFTLESDILYSHPTYSSFMEGTIVVSTYPLFNKNQAWSVTSKGQQKRLQFPNNGAQGVYNATLALLDRQGEMIEYTTPFKKNRTGDATRPSVWITTVGREGLWPLRFYSDYEDPADYVTKGMVASTGAPVEARSRQMHIGFMPFMLVLLSIYCLICCFGYLKVYRWPQEKPFPPNLRSLDIFLPRQSARRQRTQNRHLFILFLALTLLYTWLGTLFLVPRAADIKAGAEIHLWERLYIAGRIYCAFLLAATTLVSSLRLVSSEKRFLRLLLLKGMRARRTIKKLALRRAIRKLIRRWVRPGQSTPAPGFMSIPPAPPKRFRWLENRLLKVSVTVAGLLLIYGLTVFYAVPNLFSMIETVLFVYRQPGKTVSLAASAAPFAPGGAGQAQAGLLPMALAAEKDSPASEKGSDEPLMIET